MFPLSVTYIKPEVVNVVIIQIVLKWFELMKMCQFYFIYKMIFGPLTNQFGQIIYLQR